MARPDRQRKAKKTPDPNTRFNPMTGRREPIPQRPLGKNPLDVKQFPDALPTEIERDLRRNRPGLPPLELPSDFPEPGRGMPPGFNPSGDIRRMQKQIDQVKLDRSLRSQLEAKKKAGRKQTAMRAANTRRQTRTFRDPSNLQRFVDSRPTGPTQTTQTTRQDKPQDMDDTIVKSGGQNYRYDAEIDAFTPVNFDPAKNRFVFAGEDEAATAKAQSASVEDSMKVAQRAFDKQMGELRGLADQDQQFGDMYQELQSEYMSILRDQNLRPEERNAALQDLFDRGSSTFELTSGFARAAKEQEAMQKQAEAKSKMDEDMQYRHRRALEAKDAIRKKQEDARYEDRKTRSKFSQTSQEIDKAYEAYKKPIEAKNNSLGGLAFGEEEVMSLEDFTDAYYKRMHQDEEVQDAIREIDGQMSIIETEIGQLKDEDPLAYRNQLTEIYGAGRQDAADAAFQDYLNTREARIAGKTQQLNALRATRQQTLDRRTVGEDLREMEMAATRKQRAAEMELESREQQRRGIGRAGFDEYQTGKGTDVVGKTEFSMNPLMGFKKEGKGLFSQSRSLTEDMRRGESEAQRNLARVRALDRDDEGRVLNTNSPEYVSQQLGNRVLLGQVRRLARASDPKNFTDRAKYFGGGTKEEQERNFKRAEVKALKALEPLILKENPGIDPEGSEFRKLRYERLQQLYDFERELGEQQA